jgi:5-enolpyruvylshikimate-3-phosphate synthase
MSLTVAAMGAEGESILKDSSCVSKTYPLFFDDMKKIGANIET